VQRPQAECNGKQPAHVKTLEAQFGVFKMSTYSCLTRHHKRFLIQADMKAKPKLVNQEGSKKTKTKRK
jgi:hypothetical protein